MFLHEKILNIKRLPIPLLHTLKGLSQIDFNLLFRVVLDTLPFTLLRPVNLVFPIQKVKKPTNKSGSCFLKSYFCNSKSQTCKYEKYFFAHFAQKYCTIGGQVRN